MQQTGQEEVILPHRSLLTRVRDKLRGRLSFLIAWPALLVLMRRRRPTELWIGDSHAMTFNRHIDYSTFMLTRRGQLILRIGPRLMWSLARKGFPERVERAVRLASRFARPDALYPVFCAGEVDVRNHLTEHPDTDYAFVERYVEQCRSVAQRLKASRLALVVPPPPCDVDPRYAWWPVIGTIEERVAVHARMRAALHAAAAAHEDTTVLDFTDLLADETGKMPMELSTEGVHTNAVAIERIHTWVAANDPLGLSAGRS